MTALKLLEGFGHPGWRILRSSPGASSLVLGWNLRLAIFRESSLADQNQKGASESRVQCDCFPGCFGVNCLLRRKWRREFSVLFLGFRVLHNSVLDPD